MKYLLKTGIRKKHIYLKLTFLIHQHVPKDISPSNIYIYSYPKEELFKNWSQLLTNTFNSLNEVEFFLRDFKKFSKYLKLYKILK